MRLLSNLLVGWAHTEAMHLDLLCRLVKNMQELPLNMGPFVKDFAEHMFNYLSGTAISANNSSQVIPTCLQLK